MNDSPAYDELADDEDNLGWSWDALTNGVRDQMPDDDLVGRALFEGVPPADIEAHKAALEALGGA